MKNNINYFLKTQNHLPNLCIYIYQNINQNTILCLNFCTMLCEFELFTG